MIKKFLIFTCLMFVCLFSVNASTSYVGLPHIEVEELPTASEEHIGYIYDYNDKYYVVETKEGGLRNILAGDNLLDKTLILDFPADREAFCSNLTSSYQQVIIGKSTTFNHTIYQFNNGTNCLVSYVGNYTLFQFRGANSDYNKFPITLEFEYNSTFCQSTSECKVTKVNSNYASYQYIKIYGDVSYEWKEIGYYEWYEFNAESTDFYLLFNFTDISSFDIFSSYDFSSFSDFEKITTTILINILFLGFIGLCVYIIIKAINKLITWLF